MNDTYPEPAATARQVYEAYVNKDREAIEQLIADDFHFTSPRDNRLNRATYLARCWPNAHTVDRFDFVHLIQDGARVFVTYDLRTREGSAFRNTEILTIRDGKLIEAEVFFGWMIPHEAADGGSL
ncbi:MULTISPECIES: nuclear transport factor 2 family protein [unclassified Caballeronia]|uniref:nuclear transport factor 2 family protein n=1 Tax=unclassified Caballeronia TaxID=2646786 RepID=UPI002857933E|nr:MULTISPECIES: nuclear transport factor 2 family protein [unclassified Caballeronia]MDR5817550.1 nuclear transport factor 2 family protein [Caballeronia sp. LZ033]MDR5824495.1 nuclear transport factor 2 family protein [Caballeronia sp. LZ043]